MLVNSSANIPVNDLARAKAQTDPVRTAVRFPIHIPISLHTVDGDLRAMTVDISACGMLFSASRSLPLHSRVEFNIPMPSAILGTETDVIVRCIGRVVRQSSSTTPAPQTAVVIDEYTFRT
jgi:hypothetical protein